MDDDKEEEVEEKRANVVPASTMRVFNVFLSCGSREHFLHINVADSLHSTVWVMAFILGVLSGASVWSGF